MLLIVSFNNGLFKITASLILKLIKLVLPDASANEPAAVESASALPRYPGIQDRNRVLTGPSPRQSGVQWGYGGLLSAK